MSVNDAKDDIILETFNIVLYPNLLGFTISYGIFVDVLDGYVL